MIRRILTLSLCAGAFWLGMQFEARNTSATCRAASGHIDPRGICMGAVQ